MNKQQLPANPGRRTALKTIGLASAAVMAQPIVAGLSGSARSAAAAGTFIANRASMRVALLVPGGSQSAVARSFNDGFNLALEMMDTRRIVARVQDIGNGVGRASRFARAQADKRDVDVVVGLMSSRVARWMQEDLQRAEVPLITANAGERAVHDDAVSPMAAYTSLEMAAGAYAAGQWAANAMGRRCVIAASYREVGYDIVHAFRAGFESAGGTVIESYTFSAPASGITVEEAARRVAASNADVVGAFATGADAAGFFTALATLAAGRSPQIIGSPLVTAQEAAGLTVHSGTPWTPALANDTNREFTSRFAARYTRAADHFAVLGYEVGRMLPAMRQWSGSGSNGLGAALQGNGFSTPRGEITVDARTNQLSTPLYLRRLAGGTSDELVAEISSADTARHLIDALPQEHGWISSYMTV